MRSTFWSQSCLLLLVGWLTLAGCSRAKYRQAADRDSYGLLDDRLQQTPWHPDGLTIEPDGRSRLYDPADPDCTPLPDPQPRLYAYQIPPLESDTDPRSGNLAQDAPSRDSAPQASPATASPATGFPARDPFLPPPPRESSPDSIPPDPGEAPPGSQPNPLPDQSSRAADAGSSPQGTGTPTPLATQRRTSPTGQPTVDSGRSQPVAHATNPRTTPRVQRRLRPQDSAPPQPGSRLAPSLAESPSAAPAVGSAPPAVPAVVPRADRSRDSSRASVQTVSGLQAAPTTAESDPTSAPPDGLDPAADPPSDSTGVKSFPPASPPTLPAESPTTLPSQVRPGQWEALPVSVQQRMLEFEQLSRVYSESFSAAPTAELQPAGRVLTLENIVELGQLNSRELQTQKETLYKAALAVSLEQFQYLLKFTPFGNGGDLAYRTRNFDSDYFAALDNRAHAEVDKLLVTGGTFVGRLANNVLMTFNGPDGFAADVSSQLLFDISQPIFQRDIRFEPLTRAERQLVYAARSFLRFRKTFFVNLATSYYAILRAYRQIAIESQNYFSLSGAHQQSLIELEAGLRSRIQTEQIEQNMLTGRSRLISAGVTLERALDRLKIDLGLPPELPIRIDLQELDDVTGRDETSVAAEAVRRTRERLVSEQGRDAAQLPLLVNAALVLQQRLQQWRASRTGAAGDLGFAPLEELGGRLALLDARLALESQRRGLAEIEASPEPTVVRLVQRRLDVLDSQLRQLEQQLGLARLRAPEVDRAQTLSSRIAEFASRVAQARQSLAESLDRAQLDRLPALEQVTSALVAEADALAAEFSGLPGGEPVDRPVDEESASLRELLDQLLQPARDLLAEEATALPPVEMALDDAMLTALALRLDLMNRRGEIADARRLVKLAADDLRSVLNLQATQVLSTDALGPYDRQFDDARTELRVALDLPLNRQQQRNTYRIAQINYQVARRTEMQAEDLIKLEVRDNLRNLALARNQYQIGIASAALANERVASTQLELALGFPGVAARDFLEAQDAFRQAVSGVADNHLGYLVNRIQFFLSLELLELDDRGFWTGLRDEQLQPTPQFLLPPSAGLPYGSLPPAPWFSRELQDLYRGP